MRIFDSHCHLDDDLFRGDWAAVMDRAAANEVKAMMIVGVGLGSSERAVALASDPRHPHLFASVGIHPHDASQCDDALLAELIRLSHHPAVVAWGETGLDFNRMFSPRDDQERCFVRQLEIADELDLPLIFHERDSGGRFRELLQATPARNRRGVVHCFSGSRAEMQAYLAMGLHIGITGILTIKGRGKQLRELVGEIPIDRLLIETDAPYLTPTPERNKYRRNEPAFVRRVLVRLAEVLAIDVEPLADRIWRNTCALYGVADGAAASDRDTDQPAHG
ncbi:MAG: TatD family hydrolase [Desulfosarcinaceae bacterium]|nr:TatD family hydrolase [Desulfosarcinaceae bacterium]